MTSGTPSLIFQLSDEHITEAAKLSPTTATFLGITGYDHLFDDFSLEGSKKKPALIRETLRKLASIQPQNEIDQIAAAVVLERPRENGEANDETPRGLTQITSIQNYTLRRLRWISPRTKWVSEDGN